MRNCERCYDSYFCNYSGNLWDHCPACRRSILDVQDRRHYDAVQQQLKYAYGWGYNIEYDVAQYDYILNEDGSLTYSCRPSHIYHAQVRQLIIDGFLARIAQEYIEGATSQYMLDTAYGAGVDEACHSSFFIRHETKGFTFTYRAEPKVHFVFNDNGEVTSMAYVPFEDKEMRKSYGRGCADYIRQNPDLCQEQAETRRSLCQEQAETRQRIAYEAKVQSEEWVDERAVRNIKRLKYFILIPWILLHVVAASYLLVLSYPEPEGFWASSWHKAKYYVFILGIYVSAHIPYYVANHRITVANCRYSEKKRDELLQPLDVPLQVVAVNKNPPEPSGTYTDSTKYWTLWRIFLALVINVGGMLLAVYLFETYVWSIA
jgi:hypothetical protein